MFYISYSFLVLCISIAWVLLRALIAFKQRRIHIQRELQLLLVYICIVVVVRFTFFPFSRVDGVIQPLVLVKSKILTPRVNLIPFVYLFDYPVLREALLNLIGNITMFIPLGIVWPCVFKKLNSHAKVIGAGISVSLLIELLQLPFYDRVSDIDDLILNSTGFILGYLIYLLSKFITGKLNKTC